MSRSDDADRAVHSALSGYLDEGEMLVCWVVSCEVVGPNGVHYLAHRAGAGYDGTEDPTVWNAVGMLEAAREDAMGQLDLREHEDDDE